MSPHERGMARVLDQSGWHPYRCSKRATTELAGAKVCGTHANVLRRRRFLNIYNAASAGGSWREVRLAHSTEKDG